MMFSGLENLKTDLTSLTCNHHNMERFENMTLPRYSTTIVSIGDLLEMIRSGKLVAADFREPFAWSPGQMCELVRALHRGLPQGEVIVWSEHPGGAFRHNGSANVRVLIDGHHRLATLMACLHGEDLPIDQNGGPAQVRLAFNPQTKKFRINSPARPLPPSWLPDIVPLFGPDLAVYDITQAYCEANPRCSTKQIWDALEQLRGCLGNRIGLIELDHTYQYPEVLEVFNNANAMWRRRRRRIPSHR